MAGQSVGFPPLEDKWLNYPRLCMLGTFECLEVSEFPYS